jgi:hypothetical protein
VFAAKTIVVLRVMPADENAAARRFASGPVADTIAALSFAVSNTRAAPSAPFWTTRPSPRRTTRSASPFISTTRPCASTMITPVEKWSNARAATSDFHSSSRSRIWTSAALRSGVSSRFRRFSAEAPKGRAPTPS